MARRAREIGIPGEITEVRRAGRSRGWKSTLVWVVAAGLVIEIVTKVVDRPPSWSFLVVLGFAGLLVWRVGRITFMFRTDDGWYSARRTLMGQLVDIEGPFLPEQPIEVISRPLSSPSRSRV